jgi:hypothetical protein
MRCKWALALVILAGISTGAQARVLLEDRAAREARRAIERVQRDAQRQFQRVSCSVRLLYLMDTRNACADH